MHLNSAFPAFTAINKGREGGWITRLIALWGLGWENGRKSTSKFSGSPTTMLIKFWNTQFCQASIRGPDSSAFTPGLAAVASLGLRVTLAEYPLLGAFSIIRGSGGCIYQNVKQARPLDPPVPFLRCSEQPESTQGPQENSALVSWGIHCKQQVSSSLMHRGWYVMHQL